MKILEDIEKYLNREKIDEALTLTRQHYTWFLDVFAKACKQNNVRRTIYLGMLDSMMADFAATNPNFKPALFMSHAKKLYNADESEKEEE